MFNHFIVLNFHLNSFCSTTLLFFNFHFQLNLSFFIFILCLDFQFLLSSLSLGSATSLINCGAIQSPINLTAHPRTMLLAKIIPSVSVALLLFLRFLPSEGTATASIPHCSNQNGQPQCSADQLDCCPTTADQHLDRVELLQSVFVGSHLCGFVDGTFLHAAIVCHQLREAKQHATASGTVDNSPDGGGMLDQEDFICKAAACLKTSGKLIL